jgi:hypothetical protein
MKSNGNRNPQRRDTMSNNATTTHSVIRQKRDDGGVKKTLTAFVRRADEGTLSRLLVEIELPPCCFTRESVHHPQRGGNRL